MVRAMARCGKLYLNEGGRHCISEVSTLAGSLVPHIRWQGNSESFMDVGEPIRTYRLYRPLRKDPALFASAHVGEYGAEVDWAGGIDMAADLRLWQLAAQQGTMPSHVASGSLGGT